VVVSESIFVRTNHLFLRAPDGGVEDVASMGAAGFGAIFCNVGDYPLDRWSIVRERAQAAGVVCGPWLRTAEGGSGDFDPERLGFLIDVADDWRAPLIVNSESELKGTGRDVTSFIADEVGERDAALSMEPWPFANVDWSPVAHLPLLPQIFGPSWAEDADDARAEWYRVGMSCVVSTFGSYSGWSPDLYDRLSPYGVYTGDDCGNDFARWAALGTRDPYAPDTPTNGGDDDVQTIGYQDGITAAVNRLRSLDPGGTLLVQSGGKWPSIDTLTVPVENWKAYDKLERTLRILKDDHDAAVQLDAAA